MYNGAEKGGYQIVKIILLSGGSGKRLWPLSNDTRSKQFLKLLKNDNGEYESMIQRIYRQLNKVNSNVSITIATGENQQDAIKNQLGEKVDLVLEPARRDTFPAIMLSTAYLAFEKKVDLEETVIVLPIDPYAELEYFSVLKDMDAIVQSGRADMALMGIKPTEPSEKYGYILGKKEEKFVNEYTVTAFCEKPSKNKAEHLIKDGAFWNGGVFAFKLGYAIQILKRYMPYESYKEIYLHYLDFKKISFDYEVVEKVKNIRMSLYNGYWKDLGTWNVMTDWMTENSIGQAMMGEETQNTHVINELDIPVIVLGVKDLVVATSPDGILVSDKEKSDYMKPYVEQIQNRPMFEERCWGDYKVLHYKKYKDSCFSLTKYVYIRKGEKINYQSHKMREEIWTIVDGKGRLILDGIQQEIVRGDVIHILPGQKHSVMSLENLHFIETQIGKEVIENDVEWFEWNWN